VPQPACRSSPPPPARRRRLVCAPPWRPPSRVRARVRHAQATRSASVGARGVWSPRLVTWHRRTAQRPHLASARRSGGLCVPAQLQHTHPCARRQRSARPPLGSGRRHLLAQWSARVRHCAPPSLSARQPTPPATPPAARACTRTRRARWPPRRTCRQPQPRACGAYFPRFANNLWQRTHAPVLLTHALPRTASSAQRWPRFR
jgi:hypothetical protein